MFILTYLNQARRKALKNRNENQRKTKETKN
jgi:hypothetical protein